VATTADRPHVDPPAANGHKPVPSPGLPAWIERPTAAFWGALSALRGSRIFHPHGVAYEGELTIAGGGGHGVALLDRPGRHRAIVRLSRGAGVPEGFPDTLGIALRLVDVHGPGRHQDLLMNTSIDLPVLHHLILPAVDGFFGQSYSTVLAYDVGGRTRLFGALPAPGERSRGSGSVPELEEVAARGAAAFDLAVAPVLGRLSPVGRLRLGARLPDRRAQELRFNVWNTGGGIRPTGPLQGLRLAAYRGSQAARG